MSDQGQLIPLADGIEANLGRKPKQASVEILCRRGGRGDTVSV